jgi:hypothetical protein
MGGFPTLAILVFICNNQGFPECHWWKIVLRVDMSGWNNLNGTDMRRLIRLQIAALIFVIAFTASMRLPLPKRLDTQREVKGQA